MKFICYCHAVRLLRVFRFVCVYVWQLAGLLLLLNMSLCYTSIPFRNSTISVDGNRYSDSKLSLFAYPFVHSLHLYLHLVTWSSSGYRNANFIIFLFLHSIRLKKIIFVRVDFSFCSAEHRQKRRTRNFFLFSRVKFWGSFVLIQSD